MKPFQQKQERKEEHKISGGHFSYQQYTLASLAEELDTDLINEYSPEVSSNAQVARELLDVCYAIVHETDWLLSGDTSDESYQRRLGKFFEGKPYTIDDFKQLLGVQ